MAPDNPRDAMSDNQVWRMEDYVPRLLGSSLESRQGWAYHVTSPLDGYVTCQQWVNTLGGKPMMDASRTPEIIADAAHWILGQPVSCTGNFFIDELVLRAAGVTDFERYAVSPGAPLQRDFFV